MKKADVIQLTIIILSLIIFINCLQYFFSAFVGVVYAIGMGEYGFTVYSSTITSILVTLLYAAICWQLLVKSRNIADFIYEKTGLGNSFKVISRPNDLLYILFIIVGFYYLMENLPAFVKGLVGAFKTKASNRLGSYTEYDKPVDWTIVFLRLLLPTILLMAAKPLSNYFAKNVSDEPVTIGEDIGDNDDDKLTEL